MTKFLILCHSSVIYKKTSSRWAPDELQMSWETVPFCRARSPLPGHAGLQFLKHNANGWQLLIGGLKGSLWLSFLTTGPPSGSKAQCTDLMVMLKSSGEGEVCPEDVKAWYYLYGEQGAEFSRGDIKVTLLCVCMLNYSDRLKLIFSCHEQL